MADMQIKTCPKCLKAIVTMSLNHEGLALHPECLKQWVAMPADQKQPLVAEAQRQMALAAPPTPAAASIPPGTSNTHEPLMVASMPTSAVRPISVSPLLPVCPGCKKPFPAFATENISVVHDGRVNWHLDCWNERACVLNAQDNRCPGCIQWILAGGEEHSEGGKIWHLDCWMKRAPDVKPAEKLPEWFCPEALKHPRDCHDPMRCPACLDRAAKTDLVQALRQMMENQSRYHAAMCETLGNITVSFDEEKLVSLIKGLDKEFAGPRPRPLSSLTEEERQSLFLKLLDDAYAERHVISRPTDEIKGIVQTLYWITQRGYLLVDGALKLPGGNLKGPSEQEAADLTPGKTEQPIENLRPGGMIVPTCPACNMPIDGMGIKDPNQAHTFYHPECRDKVMDLTPPAAALPRNVCKFCKGGGCGQCRPDWREAAAATFPVLPRACRRPDIQVCAHRGDPIPDTPYKNCNSPNGYCPKVGDGRHPHLAQPVQDQPQFQVRSQWACHGRGIPLSKKLEDRFKAIKDAIEADEKKHQVRCTFYRSCRWESCPHLDLHTKSNACASKAYGGPEGDCQCTSPCIIPLK